MRDQDYRDLYYHEWHRRDQVTAYTNLPMTVSTALVGGLFYLVSTYPSPLDLTAAAGVFWLLWLAAAVCLGLSIYWLIRTVHRYTYERVPTLETLREFESDRRKWAAEADENGTAALHEASEDYFEDYWQRRLTAAQAKNAANNKTKLERLDLAMYFLARAIALTALAALPYLFATLSQAQEENGGNAMQTSEIVVDALGGTGRIPLPPPEPPNEEVQDEAPLPDELVPEALELFGGDQSSPPPEPNNDETRDMSAPVPDPPPEPENEPTPNAPIPLNPTSGPPPPAEPGNDFTRSGPPTRQASASGGNDQAPSPPPPPPPEPDNDFTKNRKPTR